MDTLRDRLAELADDAPTGGAPAAELWVRGKRAHRLRAAALAATLLVVGVVGTGIGVRLADGDRSGPAPAETVDTIGLPIEYPVGADLPDLGDTPGALAAIWMVPRVGGGAPEAVGLVAETGTFGTLPIDLRPDDPEVPEDVEVALSADGRRLAYPSPTSDVSVIVHDLVSGESYSPAIESRRGYTWVDATHLLGHVAGGSDGDGWVWEPGTAAKLVDWYAVTYGDTDLSVPGNGSGPRQCSGSGASPIVQNDRIRQQYGEGTGRFDVPVLCDVLGITPSGILLGHWNSDRLPGDWNDPDDGNGTVVALDINGADPPFENPALRRVVATAGAPDRVSFATDLIGAALDADGGAS
jgi:hypothetical protein